MLKIKVAGMAAESRAMRGEEERERDRADWHYRYEQDAIAADHRARFESIHARRRGPHRAELRAAGIALAFLAGKTYAEVEPTTNNHISPWYYEPSGPRCTFRMIANNVARFGGRELITVRLGELAIDTSGYPAATWRSLIVGALEAWVWAHKPAEKVHIRRRPRATNTKTWNQYVDEWRRENMIAAPAEPPRPLKQGRKGRNQRIAARKAAR